MNDELKRDIIDWDTENWSRAIPYWQNYAFKLGNRFKCLELGASKGGLSLWLALNQNEVICSDVKNPKVIAERVHQKYNCYKNINYEAIDATNIPYINHFDLVVFKSILGGISGPNRDDIKAKTIKEIYKTLKPGGKLLFAENLDASIFHKIFRKWFGTKDWNYLRLNELNTVFSPFSKVNYTTVGFFGCFGRNEYQRIVLGKLDKLIDKLFPHKNRYIIIGVATK